MTAEIIDKRTLLVTTALDLFYRHGIHAVGINEVLKASGVAKKTLYNHFASKEALIAATVELRDGRLLNWLDDCVAEAGPGKPAIEAIFQAMDDWINERVPELGPFRGCFFINTSAEYSQPGCPIFERCQRHKQAVRERLLQQLRVMMLAEPEAMADQLMLLKEGAIVAAHLMGDRQAGIKAGKTALLLLDSASRVSD